MATEIRRHRWGLYFAVEDFGRSRPTRHTKDGIDVSLLKDIRPVSIEAIKLFVTVHGMIADVTCQATFRNVEDEHIDGFFLFPVEEAAALYHFEASARGTKIVAATREKGEHWEYNLLEQLDGEGILLEESSREIFTCHLGVVAPDEVVETMFQFSLEMDITPEGDVQFLFPSFVPREYQAKYMDFAYGQMEQHSYNVDDYSFDFYFHATVASNYRIKDVVSREVLEIEYLDPQHHNAKLMLAGSYLPNRDFAFVIRYADIESPHLLIHTGQTNPAYEHFVIQNPCAYYTLFHRLNKTHVKSIKGEFIICIDKSASMRGAKMQIAREALLYFIKGLPQGCYFNIVGFSSTETPLFKSSRVYNQYNCMKAIKYQMKMRTEMAHPNILSVLQYLYSQPIIAGHPKQIFLITEGNITNISECIEHVAQKPDFARIFTVGIGDTIQRPLVSGLARVTNAKAHFVRLSDKPYSKILDCLKHAVQPGLSELELEFDTPAGVKCLTIPPTIPPIVFAEEKLAVFILISGQPLDPTDQDCSVTLKGMLGREPYSHTLSFNLQDQMMNENYPIHRLALRTEIADLERSISQALGADDILENEVHIVQASLAANVASRFTPLIPINVHTGQEVEGYPIIKIKPEDNPYRINSSGMDMYSPGAGSVYKSVSRLTLNRPGVMPSTFVRGIFEQPNRGQPARPPGMSMADSRIHDFDDEIGNADDLMYSHPKPTAALADVDSDLALSEVYMGVNDKDEWEQFKESLKHPRGFAKFQTEDGYWDLNKKTAYAFGSTISEVKKDNPLRNDIIWTTILAVNWFYCNFPQRKTEWKESEDWARAWVYQQDLEGYSLDELLELAAELKHLDGHVIFKPEKAPQRQISTIEEESDPSANLAEPIQYLRQDSISVMPADIDYMGEEEYANDEVGDIHSQHVDNRRRRLKETESGRPPRSQHPKPAERSSRQRPEAAPRSSTTPRAPNRPPRRVDSLSSSSSILSQDPASIEFLSLEEPPTIQLERWDSSASLEPAKQYQPIRAAQRSATKPKRPIRSHELKQPVPARIPKPAERTSLLRASPSNTSLSGESGYSGQSSPQPTKRTTLRQRPDRPSRRCDSPSSISPHSQSTTNGKPTRPSRDSHRPSRPDHRRGYNETESETSDTTEVHNSKRIAATDRLARNDGTDHGSAHKYQPARFEPDERIRKTVYTKTKRVTTATIYFTRYNKYRHYEELHRHIKPGYSQL